MGSKRIVSEGRGWVGVARVVFLMVAITSTAFGAGVENKYVKAEDKFAKEVLSESWAEWAKEKLTGNLGWKNDPHQDQEEAKDNIQNLAASGAGEAKETAQKTEEAKDKSLEEAKEKAARKMEEAKEKAYQQAQEAKEKVQQAAAYNKDKEGGDPEDRHRSDKAEEAEEEPLSWVKEKAKEKYEAAKTKAQETLEAVKQKSNEMVQDNLLHKEEEL